jgi:hypothetical protein
VVRFLGSRAALAAMVAMAVAACGGDQAGAGAGGDGSSGLSQTGPGPGGGTVASAVEVAVTGAIPASGNAVVTGTTATSSVPVPGGTQRLMVAEGTGNGLAHQFSVLFDGVTGTVLRVDHLWGPSVAVPEARTACVATPVVGGPPACGGVAVDVLNRRLTFRSALLRGTIQGTASSAFTSILTGTITYAAP